MNDVFRTVCDFAINLIKVAGGLLEVGSDPHDRSWVIVGSRRPSYDGLMTSKRLSAAKGL